MFNFLLKIKKKFYEILFNYLFVKNIICLFNQCSLFKILNYNWILSRFDFNINILNNLN